MAKQDEYVRYTLRMPAELYEKLKSASGAKSINAEIIERLELTLKSSDLGQKYILAIDDPETNLHPKVIEKAAELAATAFLEALAEMTKNREKGDK